MVFVNRLEIGADQNPTDLSCYSHSPPDRPLADYNRYRQASFDYQKAEMFSKLKAQEQRQQLQSFSLASRRQNHFDATTSCPNGYSSYSQNGHGVVKKPLGSSHHVISISSIRNSNFNHNPVHYYQYLPSNKPLTSCRQPFYRHYNQIQDDLNQRFPHFRQRLQPSNAGAPHAHIQLKNIGND